MLTIYTHCGPRALNDTANWKLESNVFLAGEIGHTYEYASDIKGTYYFDPLKSNAGPYAEREFLNPVSAFNLRARSETTTGATASQNGLNMATAYVHVMNKHIFTPRAHYTDFEGLRTYGLGIEYAHLLSDTSRVFGGLGLSQEALASGEVIVGTLDAGYRKLWLYHRGRGLATQFHSEYIDSENESRKFSVINLKADADYYITRKWGIGSGLKISDSDIDRFSSLTLDTSTNYYFTPNIGMEFGAGVIFRKENSAEIEAGLSLNVYF